MATTLADLKPDPANARKHNPRNIDMIVDSLQKVGAARSIVIDEDNIILAGNGVIEAAAEAGIERVQVIDADGETIIAVRRTGLTDEQKIKLALYDNRTAELAEWDPDVLAELDVDLGDLFFDGELEALGLDVDEPPEDPGPQIDRAAELQEKWQVKRGDVWQIGKHRLMCGDSTSAEDVAKLMGGERADWILADPPYGVGMEYGMYEDDPARNEELVITAFSKGPASRIWTPGLKNLARELRREPKAAVISWFRRFSVGWPPHACSWATVWEPVLIVNPKKKRLKTDHLEYMTDRESLGPKTTLHDVHPCPKALGLWTELIEGLIETKEVVYDPFLGSGTSIVACEQVGRICYGMEISEAYCAVTLERMADMGLEPVLVT